MTFPPLVWYAVLCAGPAAAFWVIERGARAWTGQTPFRVAAASVETRQPHPTRRPIEHLASDLGRLRDELHRLRRAQSYARRHRMTAVALAYDDVLLDCCRALEIPAPDEPLDDVERLRLEAELESSGLRW